MAQAFELVPNMHAFLDGHKCDVRRGTIGEVTGKLYVNTGAFFALLTATEDGFYTDNQGRIWTLEVTVMGVAS